MNYRTRQNIFNGAYKGLASQGFQQSIEGRSCRYRGPNKTKCAIGYLIPDARYSQRLEGMTPFNSDVAAAARIKKEDQHFASRLQDTHDLDGDNPEDMKSALLSFAKKYCLTVPAV